MVDVIPDPKNLPVEAMPWARAVTKNILQLLALGAQSGQRNVNTLAQLQSTIQALGVNLSNLNTRFTAALTTMTFDAGQVISGVFNIARIPTIPAANVSGTWTNSVSTTGTVGATGNIASSSDLIASNNVSAGNNVFAPTAGLIGGNIPGTRLTAWIEVATGRIGNTSSSERFKMNIRESAIDPLKVLTIMPKYYQYISEVRKRDDPTYEFYVGPNYHVALEIGMIAEDLHAAGLWEFVAYHHDKDGKLSLDPMGNPIPDSIHYANWAIALQVVARYQQKRIDNLESRLLALESKVV